MAKKGKRKACDPLVPRGGCQQKKRLGDALLTDETAQPLPQSALALYLAHEGKCIYRGIHIPIRLFYQGLPEESTRKVATPFIQNMLGPTPGRPIGPHFKFIFKKNKYI